MDRIASGKERAGTGLNWLAHALLGLFLVFAFVVVLTTNTFLSERYTASTKSRAEVRQALFVGNLLSELQRTSVVASLLSGDPKLIGALEVGDFARSSQHILEVREETGVASIMLLDESGRTVAATDRNLIGSVHRSEPYFVSAMRSNDVEFSTITGENGVSEFIHSRRIEAGSHLIGIIVVGSNLRRFEKAWSAVFDAALVTDSEGRIILATDHRWYGLSVPEADLSTLVWSSIAETAQATPGWTSIPAAGFYGHGALIAVERRIPYQGWRMVSFTSYAGVRERVNTVLALEIMLFAILLASGFYFFTRRAIARSMELQRESAELRRLNESLLREIGERQRAEKNLEVAEQTIAQSSKMAALGEMSASIGHELNQPLAAIKTYLAGARLLLEKRRLKDALDSVERIDELIDRMGTISRHLKSYAHNASDAVGPRDARDCVTSAISLMDPLLKERNVSITCNLPGEPVIVMVDRVRLDQVLVNLLRNAVDATEREEHPEISVTLSVGNAATISVRDNGPGIENLDSLFEPFYTTKAPGEGTGLGLAISSSIIKNFHGRLTARNSSAGGAVFEVRLPSVRSAEAAE